MRKIFSKILTVVLVCTMLAGLFAPAVSAAGAQPAADSQIYGWNLTLADEIAVNFWVDISDEISANAVMKVTDGKDVATYRVCQQERNEDGKYLFTAYLAAAQLADEIKLELQLNGVTVGEQTYCALDYANYVLGGKYSDTTKALMRSMLHYGAAAQTYFGYNTEKLANNGMDAAEEIAVPQWDEGAIVSGKVPGVRFYGASLVFDSRVAVRFYFEAESVEGISFGDYEVTEKNGKYCVEVPGINPQNYDDTISLPVSDGENEMTVSYSPMTYIARQYAKSSNEAMRDLVARMYQYHLAAESYLGSVGSSNVSGFVNTDNNGIVTDQVILEDQMSAAVIAAGTQLEEDTGVVTLFVVPMEESGSDVEAGEDEQMLSLDVHVEGVAQGNTVPVLVTVNELAPEFLNKGNISLYHVEDGVTVEMTRVYSAEELDEHNEYYYDIATGTVTMALASFSEVAITTSAAKWEGGVDYTWYDADAKNLYIYNADQLAGFSAIVGEMDGRTQDSFSGKTVTLMADIDLDDAEADNDPNKIFYPIGYWNEEGTYEKTQKAISSGFYAFQGTFDGNGHTISNFYQNTWEMKGDHDWYDAELQYFRDGMGLFGKVYGGTVKNLTVKNFSSDGEIATTGVIAAYADSNAVTGQSAVFENITIFDCNPRVYNIGNGGIVGCAGWYSRETDAEGLPVTFKNITVDQSNKISALWGSWGVSCAGILGQYYPNSNCGVYLENCHVAAQIDVNNDVCSNYQYYWYRYAGMFIGTIRANTTDADGYTVADLTGIKAIDCTYTYGDWNEYWYCELVVNSLASYTHDHQFSRLTKISDLSEIQDEKGNWDTAGNFVMPNADNTAATCYHIMTNSKGELYRHFHNVADESNPNIYEDFDLNGDDQLNDLKEDRYCYFIPFGQVLTGLDMGVKPYYELYKEGELEFELVEDGIVKSEQKFAVKDGATTSVTTGATITLGDLFYLTVDESRLSKSSLYVSVSPVNKDDNVSAAWSYDNHNWADSTLTFSGTGTAQIIIQDYFYCKPTVINVTITEPDFVPGSMVTDINDILSGGEFAIVVQDYTMNEDKTRTYSGVYKAMTTGINDKISAETVNVVDGVVQNLDNLPLWTVEPVAGTTNQIYITNGTEYLIHKAVGDTDFSKSTTPQAWSVEVAPASDGAPENTFVIRTTLVDPNNSIPGRIISANNPATEFGTYAWSNRNNKGWNTYLHLFKVSVVCEHNIVDVEAKAATCTEAGNKAGKKCSICGLVIEGCETINALTHQKGETTTNKEATCTETGEKQWICTREGCGHVETIVIPVKEHSYETQETTPATCTEAGVKTFTCTYGCGYSYTEEIAALGHSYNAVVTDPTCVAGGYTTYTCSACGDTYTDDETEATGNHTYVDGFCSVCNAPEPDYSGTYYIASVHPESEISKNYYYMTSDLGTASTKRYQAADSGLTELPETITAPESGYAFVLVKNADGSYSIYVDGMDGDKYLGWTSENSGTLVAETNALKLTVVAQAKGGLKIYAASADRYLALNNNENYFAWYKDSSDQQEVLYLVPVVVCDHNYVAGEVKEPSCTEAGYTTYTCSLCNHVKKDDVVAALGHTEETVAGKAATCTETGLTDGKKCSVCGVTTVEQEEIDALGHSYSSVVTPPTVTEPGYTTYTCTVCGDTYKDNETPALGQSYTVSFSVPKGVAAVADMTCNSTGITLPSAAAPAGYTFAGWVTATLDNSDAKPTTIYKADETYTATENTTLYALYSYAQASEGTGEDSFVKVTENLTDWSGTYLIVYEAGNVAFDGSLTTLDAASNTIGVAISNNAITSNDTTNAAVFVITKIDGGYAIQSASGYYIGRTATSNGLNSNITTKYLNSISTDTNGNAIITSSDGPILRFNKASDQNRFRYYGSGQQAIALYKLTEAAGESTIYYTTVIPCQHPNTTTTTVDANCITPGSTTVTCDDCDEIISTEVIPATGEHNYVDGTCSVCGAEKPVEPSEPVETTGSIDFTSAGHRVSQDSSHQTWKNGDITLTNTKGSGSGTANVVGDVNPAKFYANSTVKIECAGMKQIVFTCSSSNYATALGNSLKDLGTVTVDGSVVTIVFASSTDSITFAMTAQTRVKQMVVSYSA